MLTTAAVQSDMYVQCDKHICLGEYADKVNCMYTTVSGHIGDCIEFV